MTDSEKIKLLQDYQLWRMGSDEIAQPNPKDITEALNYAIKCCSVVESGIIAEQEAVIEQLRVDISCMESEIIGLNYALDNPE